MVLAISCFFCVSQALVSRQPALFQLRWHTCLRAALHTMRSCTRGFFRPRAALSLQERTHILSALCAQPASCVHCHSLPRRVLRRHLRAATLGADVEQGDWDPEHSPSGVAPEANQLPVLLSWAEHVKSSFGSTSSNPIFPDLGRDDEAVSMVGSDEEEPTSPPQWPQHTPLQASCFSRCVSKLPLGIP